MKKILGIIIMSILTFITVNAQTSDENQRREAEKSNPAVVNLPMKQDGNSRDASQPKAIVNEPMKQDGNTREAAAAPFVTTKPTDVKSKDGENPEQY